MPKLYWEIASSQLYHKVARSHRPARQILRALKLYYKVASSQLPVEALQIAPLLKLY